MWIQVLGIQTTLVTTSLKHFLMTRFSFGYLIPWFFFTLQRELSFKVQIFEKKVESYKKVTRKLSNAMEYIKVKLLTRLTVFILHLSVYNLTTSLYKLQNWFFAFTLQSLNKIPQVHTPSFSRDDTRHITHHGLQMSSSCLCVRTLNWNSLLLTQYQAGQAEKQIKVEFERLHKALVTEEALRLKALATEEEHKIASIQKMIDNTNDDIDTLNKLTDTLKKEMGNEDLPLLRVREGSLSSQS